MESDITSAQLKQRAITHDEVLAAIMRVAREDPDLATLLAHNHWCIETLKGQFEEMNLALPKLVTDAIKKEFETAAQSKEAVVDRNWVRAGIGASCLVAIMAVIDLAVHLHH